VPQGAEVIVVHDAARPLAPPSLFRAVVDAVRAGADAAVPGLAVADTIKEVRAGVVVGTLDRASLVAVQTPQAFRAPILRRAHDAGGDATDDATLIERLGGQVVVVEGDPRALKVTVLDDLARVEAML
jgi:2-C-methyl-D-erythritol 4-phosphate cytidylyltransferase